MKHQFKPFDQVLVRDSDDANWYPAFYKYYDSTDIYPHHCDNTKWRYCIPYNENTVHLIGTNEPYKEPEPKVWQIASTGYNDTMTSEELSNFIQGAVINNKDITDFRIRYIGQ